MKKFLFVLVLFLLLTVSVSAEPIDANIFDESFALGGENSLFGTGGEIIDKILSNQPVFDSENLFIGILELLFSSVKKNLPLISGMLSVAIILAVLENFKFFSPKIEATALLGGKIVFSVLLFGIVGSILSESKEVLLSVMSFTQRLTPPIVTLLAASGAGGSVTALAPMATISSTMILFIVNLVFPLLCAGCVVTSVNCALSGDKLSGINELLKTVSTWALGGLFTVYSAILGIQGLTAGVRDGISIKGIKYAINTTVPIIGSSISDSLSMVLSSAYHLKSAAGIAGIIVIAGMVVAPILNLVSLILILNVFSACVQPFTSQNIISQIASVCEYLKLVCVSLIGVSVLWFIFLGIITCAGSYVL